MNLATLKLIGYGVAALAAIGLLAMINGWRVERDHLRVQVAATCALTRSAANNPKLDCKQVDPQIRLLGQAIVDLKAGIAHQNAAVTALATESGRQKAAAAQAVLSASTRARASQATSARLAASSRSSEAQAKPCAASKTLTGAWR